MDGISCQHLTSLGTTNLLQQHWEWQEERNPSDETWYSCKADDVHGKHGHQEQPSMRQNRNMWQRFCTTTIHTDGLLQPFLREMSGLSGMASFESVESRFNFKRCLRQGSVEAPRSVAEDGEPDFGQSVEEEWIDEKERRPLGCRRRRVYIKYVAVMWADTFGIMSHTKEHLEQMLKDLIEEAGTVDLEPEPASLFWTSTYASCKIRVT